MEKDPRIEDILQSLEIIKKKLPNGELEVIKQSILSLSQDQKYIKEDLEYFKKRLFNPDDGVIVRINKNAENLSRIEEEADNLPTLKHKLDTLDDWKQGVNKALWIIYTSIIGIVFTIVASYLKK